MLTAAEPYIHTVGGPITLVAHSYGGFVITNAAYNNPNVTGLVYVAAVAPDEGVIIRRISSTSKSCVKIF
ncbi:MAG TPA: alpha/beta hydrolase [Nitrososphaeraceae archaeon]|nr:alpha/beta hydrolase [Nitrososphaeraceae archaeon]